MIQKELSSVKSLHLSRSTLGGIKVYGFKLPKNYVPTKNEIEKILKYYQKYKDEIDSEEKGTRADYFIKGRVTYLINSQGDILYG